MGARALVLTRVHRQPRVMNQVSSSMLLLLHLSLLLQAGECLHGGASVASSLALVAENPGAREWSLGDTIRLSYVLETQADAHVSCTRDSRLISSYRFSVPTHTITVRARRLLLVRNASVENAGRYMCRARSGNASRAVGWRVRVRARDSCQTSRPCTESTGLPCTPCSCPKGRSFFGKSRLFTCYETPVGEGGSGVKLELNVSRNFYSFEQFEPAAIDYELGTYGDTQLTWMLDSVLFHTHTVLVPLTSNGLVFFRKRFFLDPPPKVDVRVEMTVEAQLRHTDTRASRSVSVLVSRSALWSSCREQNCSLINAYCAASGRCECSEGWTESRGLCRLHCHAHGDCHAVGEEAVCKEHECECARGHVLRHRRCTPLECVNHKMCTDVHGASSACHDGHCRCLAGHVMTNGSCEPVDCLDDAECSEDNMRCIGRRCRCASDFDLVENKCRKSKVGECREQLDCFLNHSTCLADEGRCVCAEGFRAVFMAGSADRACLRVSCSTDSDCEATSAGATCVRGLCVCPDDQPPQSAFCLLPQPNRFESQGVLGVTKLVTYCLGLVIGVGAFAAVSVTLLRAKASAGYEPSCPDVDDEEAAKRLDEEGAIMAAVAALRDRYVLEDGQEFEESAEAYAGDIADDMYSEEERRIDRMFVRSVFPKRSDGLFVSTHGINRGSSSSGAAVAPSSRTTVDI